MAYERPSFLVRTFWATATAGVWLCAFLATQVLLLGTAAAGRG
jgi:hypothetical protein